MDQMIVCVVKVFLEVVNNSAALLTSFEYYFYIYCLVFIKQALMNPPHSTCSAPNRNRDELVKKVKHSVARDPDIFLLS